MSQLQREALQLIVKPRIDVIQVSADGLGTYYHVKVNNKPAGELFMEVTQDLKAARVKFKRAGIEVNLVHFQTDHDQWLREAHKKVADMFYLHWPGADVFYYTHAGFGPLAERRSLGGDCADRKCCPETTGIKQTPAS